MQAVANYINWAKLQFFTSSQKLSSWEGGEEKNLDWGNVKTSQRKNSKGVKHSFICHDNVVKNWCRGFLFWIMDSRFQTNQWN